MALPRWSRALCTSSHPRGTSYECSTCPAFQSDTNVARFLVCSHAKFCCWELVPACSSYPGPTMQCAACLHSFLFPAESEPKSRCDVFVVSCAPLVTVTLYSDGPLLGWSRSLLHQARTKEDIVKTLPHTRHDGSCAEFSGFEMYLRNCSPGEKLIHEREVNKCKMRWFEVDS